MSMIRDESFDSNRQLISWLYITIKSCSSEIEDQNRDASFTDSENQSHDFLFMTELPTYHPDGFWDDQNANLDIIKFCGFGKCPNRYGYITRPDVLKKVFHTFTRD